MNAIEATPVMIYSGAVAANFGIPSGLVSMAVGMLGVALARWVFVGRENRKLGKPQHWNDTLPLTLVAILITGVIIWDQKLGLSAAAFVGLGVGWAAVLLLDLAGDRIVNVLKAGFAVPLPPHVEKMIDHSGHDGKITSHETNLPADMSKMLDQIDKNDAATRPPPADPLNQ